MNRLKEIREDKDLTQKSIASFLNLDQSNYSKLELGKLALKDDILIKLADFYRTSTDYILGLTDEMKPYPRKKQ